MDKATESSRNADSRPLVLRLGRRKTDTEIRMDLHAKRGMVKCNLAYISGDVVFLESIPIRYIPPRGSHDEIRPPGVPKNQHEAKEQIGIVLVKREWGSRFYFLAEHKDWTEDQYFEYAEELIRKGGYDKP